MSTDTTPTPDELPPLPATGYRIGIEMATENIVTSFPAWNEDAMRAYARASIAAALARAPAEPFDAVMKAAMNMAHVYSFVRDDSLPVAKRELEDVLRAALSHQSPAEPPKPLVDEAGGQQVVHEARSAGASTGAANEGQGAVAGEQP